MLAMMPGFYHAKDKEEELSKRIFQEAENFVLENPFDMYAVEKFTEYIKNKTSEWAMLSYYDMLKAEAMENPPSEYSYFSVDVASCYSFVCVLVQWSHIATNHFMSPDGMAMCMHHVPCIILAEKIACKQIDAAREERRRREEEVAEKAEETVQC